MACGNSDRFRLVSFSWQTDLHFSDRSDMGSRIFRVPELFRCMADIALAFAATAVACFTVLLMVAFWRVVRSGPGTVAYLRRKHYGLKPWALGGLSKTTDGSTLHELEGLELRASNGRLSYIRQTRAPTSEI